MARQGVEVMISHGKVMEKQSNIEITALTEIGGRDLDHEMKEYSEQFTQNT